MSAGAMGTKRAGPEVTILNFGSGGAGTRLGMRLRYSCWEGLNRDYVGPEVAIFSLGGRQRRLRWPWSSGFQFCQVTTGDYAGPEVVNLVGGYRAYADPEVAMFSLAVGYGTTMLRRRRFEFWRGQRGIRWCRGGYF